MPGTLPSAHTAWCLSGEMGFYHVRAGAKEPHEEISPFETELAAMSLDNLSDLGVLCTYKFSMVSFNSSISAIFMGESDK